nr:L693 [uncultured bacterium]
MQLPCDIAQGGRTTPPPDKESEAFGIERVVGQPGHLLLFHGPTALTSHAPDFDLQIDPRVATGEVAHPAYLVVVERPRHRAADATGSFFPRRTSRKTRALGSPKTPCPLALGRKPGNRYVSTSRSEGHRCKACHVFSQRKTPQTLLQRLFSPSRLRFLPTRLGEDPKKGEQ